MALGSQGISDEEIDEHLRFRHAEKVISIS
jgi:hypothetical protein